MPGTKMADRAPVYNSPTFLAWQPSHIVSVSPSDVIDCRLQLGTIRILMGVLSTCGKLKARLPRTNMV